MTTTICKETCVLYIPILNIMHEQSLYVTRMSNITLTRCNHTGAYATKRAQDYKRRLRFALTLVKNILSQPGPVYSLSRKMSVGLV